MPISPVVGAALIGGGASLVGASMSSRAASRSADAVQNAADSTNATQLQIYNQQRQDAEPWRQFGLQALGQLSSLYNLNWQAPTSMTGGSRENDNQPGVTGGSFSGSQDPRNPRRPNVTQVAQTIPAIPDGEAGGAAGQSALLPGEGAGVERSLAMMGGPQAPEIGMAATGNALVPPMAMPGQGGPETPEILPAGLNGSPTGASLNTAPFYASPDYQFRLNEGGRNLTNAFANTGNLDSGAAQRAMQRYSQDYAGNAFNDYVNRIASFAGMGQTVNSQNNALAQNYSNNVANNNLSAANARASAYQQQGQAWQQGLGGAAGAGIWAFNNYGRG